VNYLSHGYRHIERPWVLAGTALPDWLSVGDRRSRVSPEALEHVASHADARTRDLAEGVRRHLDDDARFHTSAVFRATEDEVTLRLRAAHAHEPRQRSRFLAHVLVEQLLDAWIMARHPDALSRYYDALESVDVGELTARATPWLSRPPTRLAEVVGRFRSSRFLAGYTEDASLVERLAGVARRVGLPPLATGTRAVASATRRLVDDRAQELLGPALRA
jgi:acyl carrier protein phosphodiesterase